MGDHLPGFLARRGKVEFIDHIVQTPLQKLQQHLAGVAGPPRRFVIVPHELPVQKAVEAFEFLLLANPDAVVAAAAAPPAVLAGGRQPFLLFDGTFCRFATGTLEHQLHSLTPALLT